MILTIFVDFCRKLILFGDSVDVQQIDFSLDFLKIKGWDATTVDKYSPFDFDDPPVFS